MRRGITDEMKNQHGATFSMSFGKPGESVPESVKQKFLERLKNPPDQQTGERTSVYTVKRGFVMDRKVTEPASGSVEAQILDHYATRHMERMAKGVTGHLVRDEQGKVLEIRADDLSQRVELDYVSSSDLPLPWPCRITRFIGSPHCEPQIPTNQMTIYSVRTSEYAVPSLVEINRDDISRGATNSWRHSYTVEILELLKAREKMWNEMQSKTPAQP